MIRFVPRLRLLHLAAIATIASTAIGCGSKTPTPPPTDAASTGQTTQTAQTAQPAAPGQPAGQPAPGQPAPGQAAPAQTAAAPVPPPTSQQTAAAPAAPAAAPQPAAPTIVATAIDPPTPGYLVSQDADARINIRSAPSTSADAPDYGIPGDSISLLQYATADDDYIWYLVSFDGSGTTGWVRGDFVTEGMASAPASVPSESAPPVTAEGGPTGISQEVQFAPGESSATMSNSVIRGTRDTYFLSFAPNQVLTASVDSMEDNAVFQLYVDVEGEWLPIEGAAEGQDADYWSGVLPYGDSGELMIVVGPTRGNASYSLSVGIE